MRTTQVHKLLIPGLMITTAFLAAACGGGGSSSSSGGGGGGGGSGTATIATPGPPNVESLTVDGGPATLPAPSINTAFVTVQVCLPGTTTCQTIDHIEIDTGSVGLRILADATDTSGATFSLALPALTAQVNGSDEPLAECLQFADGASWGSVNSADITLPVSGEHASSVNVQIIGAAATGGTTPPNSLCVPAAPLAQENTVATFGANGILGVGPFINDCNDVGSCTPGASASYYTCSSASSCDTAGYSAALAQQVPNPVTLFPKDNNGVIIELPGAPAAGAASISDGALVFGIGTENNNALGSATQLLADVDTGVISATLDGTSYPNSYLDSGSNGNFYSSSLTLCPSPNNIWYCPSSTVTENATVEGTNGTTAAATFDVANADNLFMANPTFTVFPDLAGPGESSASSSSLDFGLPFFFGLNVYTGIENPTTNSPPYFAYIAN